MTTTIILMATILGIDILADQIGSHELKKFNLWIGASATLAIGLKIVKNFKTIVAFLPY